MNPMQAMPQQAPMGGRPPMGGQPPMGPMNGQPPMGGGPQGGFSMPAKGINLFKVQEQLKDMPQQMVMAYANGQNPDIVPPYIALGEMERRTRAAKNAQPNQAPQGTVKDTLEQQIKQAAGLASLAGQKQQQMQQQQMAQSMQAPGPVPGGLPPPEDQAEPPAMMAGGGLATLPVDARMTNYRDGGIVGYAEGEVVERPYIGYRSPRRQEQPENPDFDENGNPRGRDERAAILAKNAMIAQQKAQSEKAAIRERQFQPVPSKEPMEQFYKPRSTEGPVAATAPSKAAPAAPPVVPTEYEAPPFKATGNAREDERLRLMYGELEKAKQNATSADPAAAARAKQDVALILREITRTQGGTVPTAPAGGPRPSGPGAAPQAPAGLAALPGAAPQAPSQQSPFAAEFLKDIQGSRELSARVAAPPPPPSAEQQALLNMPVEQDYMKRLRELAAKRGEEDIRSRADIEERKGMDLSRALIAAGEASRGQSGLGALAAGFGKSSLSSREARMNEEAALRNAGLTRAELLEKAQYEMGTLQRARAEGNREKERASREKLLGIEQALSTNRVQGLASVTGSEMGADTRAAVAAARAEQSGDVAKDRAIKMAEDEYARDPTVQRINDILKSPMFTLGTTPSIQTQRTSYEKQLSDIRKAKYQQHGITMAESTTAPPIDLSKWGKPTKQ